MREFYAVEERGIELVAECPDFGLPFDVYTCTALGTVVNELVANSVEHAFPGDGGRIEVRLVREEGRPVLLVADSGAGFSEAQPESIGLGVIDRLVTGAGGKLARIDAESGTCWSIALSQPSAEAPERETASVGAG
jgi:two-component sensor histidine kinase